MISGVSDYNLIPIKTYASDSGRKTSITSFADMLKTSSAEEAVQKNRSVNQDGETQSTKATGAETTGSSTSEVIYQDPVTGARIRYQDVASSKATKPSSVSGVETTSASSMKKTKYETYFQKAAAKYNVSASLLKAIAKAESNFNPKSVSSSGAMGVMQLMPMTAEGLGVKNPYDPEQNIMGGAKCIAAKLEEFKGDVRLALAAYNAGSGAVRRNGGVPSYCKSYISKVLSYKKAYETASAVG